MRRNHLVLTFAALVGVAIAVLISINQGEHNETSAPSRESGRRNDTASGRSNTPGKVKDSTDAELGKAELSIVTKKMMRMSAPEKCELRLPDSDHVQSLSVSEYSITGKTGLLWSRGQERISGVQESPDQTTVLFYNNSTAGYEVYRHENEKLVKLEIELPHRDQATRVDGWLWIGNHKLIGEHCVQIDPAPEGFGDEGWTNDVKFYLYDLKTRAHQEVSFPGVPEYEQGINKILTNKFSPSYSYELPITRYYRIKGITDKGAVSLMSLDNSQPQGGNPRDEGWFMLENK